MVLADVQTLLLFRIGALRPGRGEGSVGMRALGKLADRAGVEFLLYANPWGQQGRMGREALRHWYERFGFSATTAHLVNYWPHWQGLEMRRFHNDRRSNRRTHVAGNDS
jgi:hypothetical protein